MQTRKSSTSPPTPTRMCLGFSSNQQAGPHARLVRNWWRSGDSQQHQQRLPTGVQSRVHQNNPSGVSTHATQQARRFVGSEIRSFTTILRVSVRYLCGNQAASQSKLCPNRPAYLPPINRPTQLAGSIPLTIMFLEANSRTCHLLYLFRKKQFRSIPLIQIEDTKPNSKK